MNIKLIKQLLIALIGIFLLASCEYEYITIDPPAPPDPGDTTTVSFTAVVEPIFVASSCTNCHNSSMSLNLTTGFSYNSVYDNGTVTPGDPGTSNIYTIPHPTTGSHYKNYATEADANNVYKWIDQGALDN